MAARKSAFIPISGRRLICKIPYASGGTTETSLTSLGRGEALSEDRSLPDMLADREERPAVGVGEKWAAAGILPLVSLSTPEPKASWVIPDDQLYTLRRVLLRRVRPEHTRSHPIIRFRSISLRRESPWLSKTVVNLLG